jgi:hypothetical protein
MFKMAKKRYLLRTRRTVTLVKEKQVQEQLVNSIKKDKTKLYLIFEKQRESKSIDKQIDRLIREAIAEANRRPLKEPKPWQLLNQMIPLEVAAKRPKRQYHPLELS